MISEIKPEPPPPPEPITLFIPSVIGPKDFAAVYARLHHAMSRVISADPAGLIPVGGRVLDGLYALHLRASKGVTAAPVVPAPTRPAPL